MHHLDDDGTRALLGHGHVNERRRSRRTCVCSALLNANTGRLCGPVTSRASSWSSRCVGPPGPRSQYRTAGRPRTRSGVALRFRLPRRADHALFWHTSLQLRHVGDGPGASSKGINSTRSQ
ncbi:hypothetical protein MTP99_014420 [Tenebrio molitor]|nr:hypothetical protein MTP99_014420 [Tenebrio molitor]